MRGDIADDVPFAIEEPLQLGLVGDFALGETVLELGGAEKVAWEEAGDGVDDDEAGVGGREAAGWTDEEGEEMGQGWGSKVG